MGAGKSKEAHDKPPKEPKADKKKDKKDKKNKDKKDAPAPAGPQRFVPASKAAGAPTLSRGGTVQSTAAAERDPTTSSPAASAGDVKSEVAPASEAVSAVHAPKPAPATMSQAAAPAPAAGLVASDHLLPVPASVGADGSGSAGSSAAPSKQGSEVESDAPAPKIDAADVPEGTQQDAFDHWNALAPPEPTAATDAPASAASAPAVALLDVPKADAAGAPHAQPPSPAQGSGLKRNASLKLPPSAAAAAAGSPATAGGAAAGGAVPSLSGAPRAGTLRLQKTMRESMQVTPCAGDLRLLVRLPAHADANEWIALNTIHFYRASRMIYDSYKCLCTPQSCPSMSAGAVEYLWRDNGQYQCPTRLPASSYMSHALAEALAMIDDQSIFPIHEDQNFPPHFVQCVREMYKRLFRLFAHLYYVHYEQIKQMGSNRHLNSSFKHFILFALEFDLLSSATIAPLQQFIDHIMASNPAHAVPPSPHPRPAA